MFPYIIPHAVFSSVDKSFEIDDWLSQMKLESYLKNFTDNGYNSLDLMFLQMQTK